MASNLWLPNANAALSSPAEFDHVKAVWSAEVHAARLNSLMLPRMVRSAQPMFNSNGFTARTADFLVTGRIGAEKHLKGDKITGTQRNSISRSISVDDRPNRTSIRDEYITRMFEQVDVRRGILDNMGFALAARDEVEIMKGIALAARTANTAPTPDPEFLEGGNNYFDTAAGGIVAGFGYNTNPATAYNGGQASALALATALKRINIVWHKQNIPSAGRVCIVPVELFYDFRELETVMPTQTIKIAGGIYGNTDVPGPQLPFSQMIGGETPLQYMGWTIYPHNFFRAEYSPEVPAFRRDASADADRAGDFSAIVGLCFQSEAFGWADLMRTGVNLERPELTTDEVLWAMSWTGGGTLRPECAVTLTQS